MVTKSDPQKLLSKYRSKRDFTVTAEPSGKEAVKKGKALSFVIQKHDASHLHYDFRLEWDGVLKSWAVAKGPSFNPSEKRLAIEVEDHPLAYGSFEGIIPKGQYGGGTVMLWDQGEWIPLGDPKEEFKKGAVKFELKGQKLKGKWTLIRLKPRPKDRHPNWLLIKEKDSYAKPDGPSLPKNDDESVTTKRSLAEIAGNPGRVWKSNHSETIKEKPTAAKKSPVKRKSKPGKAVKMPEFIAPELATLTGEAPSGAEWLHEIKFDGYRTLAYVSNGAVKLYTRKGLDWTSRFDEIAEALEQLPADGAVLDGEIMVLNEKGISDFSALQARLAGESDASLTYYVFDLLHLNGKDIRGQPLIERKEKLQELLKDFGSDGTIRFSDHVEGSGVLFHKHSCEAGLEGAIAKRRDAPYRSGRGGDWLKIKCGLRQEFVIGGFVPPTTGIKGIGSLAIGAYEDGKLVYRGRVGTGYTEKISRDLRKRLDKLISKACPFAGKLPREAVRGAIWVKPDLVAEIAYTIITPDGAVRHGAFKGLREDKPSREVELETKKTTIVQKTKSANREAIEIGGVRLTHPDKVLDPETGLTKAALAEYYLSISDWIMPHLVNRPISIVRCPEGNTGECFYQRHLNLGTPPDIYPVKIKDKEGTNSYLWIKDVKGLISFVQVGALEIHPWGAKIDSIEFPDRMIFDFDPDPSVGWGDVVKAAKDCRDRLEILGLQSFVKTTGGKGLHVVVPLNAKRGWDEIKAFSKSFAQSLVDESPNRFVAVMSKKERSGKIFIDYLRNERSATTVAAYSTRARVGSPIAVPLAWDELNAKTNSRGFVTDTVMARLKKLKQDPWQDLFKSKQGLNNHALKLVK